MARIKGQGFNKEKLVFLLCSLLLAVTGYLFVTSRPYELKNDTARAKAHMLQSYNVSDTSLKGTPDSYIYSKDRDRKSPFTLDKDFLAGDENNPKPKPVTNTAPPPPPPPPPPPKKVEPKTRDPLLPIEKELSVAFVGIMRSGDRTFALLANKDGTGTFRVREGDTLQGSNYKITKIESQAIYLTDVDGTPYVLRDGRFSDVSAVANAQTKTQPKPQPKPQSQPKQQPPPQPNPEKGRVRPKPNLGNPNGNQAEPRNNKPHRQPKAGAGNAEEDEGEDDEDLEW